MNWSKLILLTFLFIPSSWTRVTRLNNAIKTAEKSYSEANYAQSVTDHLVLINEFQLSADELNFDLGLSHQYSDKVDEALTWYDQASQSPIKMLASFSFNQSGVIQGNKKEYEVALSKFQSALIKDPTNEQARYNYELLARWLKRDEERKKQDQNKPEPSDFAKRKKAEADRLVEQFRFQEALTLMQDALSQDETVAAYQDFMTTLQEVVEIDEK
jgi:tetratricopeptide (TPR) repeat protein